MKAGTRTVRPAKAGPITVTIGRNSSKIYHRPADRGRAARWMLADYSTGKRRWQTFTDEKSARAEAARMVARLNAGDAEGAGMTGAERRDLQRATDLVAPHRVDVPTACAIFAEAADLIGHENLVAAAKAYARRAPVARTPLPVGQAVLELLEAKTARGRSARTLGDLRSRLGRFAEDHTGRNLGELTTAGLQCWLDQLQGADGKPLSALSRRNFAVVIGTLFEFHRRRGVLPDNPARDLERESVKRTGEIEFWTPLEAGTILAAVSREALPALVLAMFAGLRSAEVCRITWRDVNLDAGHVVIAGTEAKTGSRRLAPIPANAIRWLRPLTGPPNARIFAGDSSQLARAISEACRDAVVPRIANGARHTAISFKVALTGDVARVALESGNSPAVIHAHYRGLATETDAKEFFAILPMSAASAAPSPEEGGTDAA
jgi:integrase